MARIEWEVIDLAEKAQLRQTLARRLTELEERRRRLVEDWRHGQTTRLAHERECRTFGEARRKLRKEIRRVMPEPTPPRNNFALSPDAVGSILGSVRGAETYPGSNRLTPSPAERFDAALEALREVETLYRLDVAMKSEVSPSQRMTELRPVLGGATKLLEWSESEGGIGHLANLIDAHRRLKGHRLGGSDVAWGFRELLAEVVEALQAGYDALGERLGESTDEDWPTQNCILRLAVVFRRIYARPFHADTEDSDGTRFVQAFFHELIARAPGLGARVPLASYVADTWQNPGLRKARDPFLFPDPG